MTVRIIRRAPFTLAVQLKQGDDWTDYWTTDEMSNDYAYTDAKQIFHELKRRIENDQLYA
jgi:hypothetical protein